MEARENAEVEASLRGRKRLAPDLHETMEQSLIGLARQFEAADELSLADPDRSGSHLGLPRQWLDRSQEDVRRSVWNLHSTSLELLSLADALHELVEYRSANQPVSLLVKVQGTERAMPDSYLEIFFSSLRKASPVPSNMRRSPPSSYDSAF